MVQAFRSAVRAAERSIHYFNGSALAKSLITSCTIAYGLNRVIAHTQFAAGAVTSR
jgi:hypothetical protein